MKFRRGSARLLRRSSMLMFVVVVVLVAVGGWAAYGATQNASWLTAGQNLDNSRYQANESAIGAGNVATLAPKAGFGTGGAFVTGGDVSATPAVDGQRVYFPDSAGHLYAVDRSTGALIWTANIADMTGIKPANGATGNDYARTTPAISGHTLIIGDQAGKFETPEFALMHPELAGAYVLGINKDTGALLWKTKVHDHFAAIVTQSAQVDGQTAYVGVSSFEEAYANQNLAAFLTGLPPFSYTCCSFRGKFVALDVNTGLIKWATYTVPAQTGYSGNAVWGSTPAIDEKRNAVYITTGNNYSLPADRVTCVQNANTNNTDPRACLPGDNFDSIISLNMTTGAVNWAYRALPSDAWNTDCGLPPLVGPDEQGNCPSDVQGPDYDFGQGPMLLTANVGGKSTDMVGAGGKSGVFTALNRDTGAKLWDTTVAPGGTEGGMQWGSATDGKRIYVARSNSGNLTQGGWSALDPSTGKILWATDDPGVPLGAPGVPFGFSAQGPVSTANGVVYACSLNPIGPQMVAMDAVLGKIKWTFNTHSSCLGGAAIANGTVYWGTGYGTFPGLTAPGHQLFAFTPNGN